MRHMKCNHMCILEFDTVLLGMNLILNAAKRRGNQRTNDCFWDTPVIQQRVHE